MQRDLAGERDASLEAFFASCSEQINALEVSTRKQQQQNQRIIDTKNMNKCLLVKWIWKIHQNPDALWFRILKAKYMNEKGFFASKESGGGGGVLSFGKGLHKVKHLFKWGTVFEVGDGQLCRFWEDCWPLGVPLRIAYEHPTQATSASAKTQITWSP